jgi:hypothetical protein
MLFEYLPNIFLMYRLVVGYKLHIGHNLLEKLTVSNEVGKPIAFEIPLLC